MQQSPKRSPGRFHAALERAKAELSALAEGEAVFAAHLEMAGDPMLAGGGFVETIRRDELG